VLYGDRVAEHVEALDLGVIWEPNAPDSVLLAGDVGATVLALEAHFDDSDRRCVVLVRSGCRYASMTPPNDEALVGHRLWESGLRGTLWAGVVRDSELVKALERQNRVHPMHSAALFDGLTHYVLPLKECVVEVVARGLAVQRVAGTTVEAAVQSRR
jgi:hypothetical protein